MTEVKKEVLVVEDDTSLREVITDFLQTEGYSVTAFADADAALKELRLRNFACVLSDFRLPTKDGIQLLREFREFDSHTPFMIMTAFGSINMAVEAMRVGGNDFITKPFDPELLISSIKDLIQHRRVVDRSCSLTRRERTFITQDPRVEEILKQAIKVARVDTSALIVGESGTGKELLARYIHKNSSLVDRPFIALNCAALPAELLESELFGHEVGAFTGATQSRKGVFELANGGTLFLDEIADMPANLQVKLLRALQEHEIKRVGGSRAIPVSTRIIAATNREIVGALADGKLRDDLYYRIAVVTFKIPPLRDRPADVQLLSEYYLNYFSSQMGKPDLKLSEIAGEIITQYGWPGNARELENVIERAVILAEHEIAPEHLGVMPSLNLKALNETQASLQEIASFAMKNAEVEVIKSVLASTGGNKTKAAKLLKVSYKTLLSKIKDYRIESTEHPSIN